MCQTLHGQLASRAEYGRRSQRGHCRLVVGHERYPGTFMSARPSLGRFRPQRSTKVINRCCALFGWRQRSCPQTLQLLSLDNGQLLPDVSIAVLGNKFCRCNAVQVRTPLPQEFRVEKLEIIWRGPLSEGAHLPKLSGSVAIAQDAKFPRQALSVPPQDTSIQTNSFNPGQLSHPPRSRIAESFSSPLTAHLILANEHIARIRD
jgi:hypothetical protein